MNKNNKYDQFSKALLNLRESFHSLGRFDDSNEKLDEIVKLLCIAYSRTISGKTFSVSDLRQIAKEQFGDPSCMAKALRFMFAETMKEPTFFNEDGTSIFGANPALSIQESEDAFAEEVVFELSRIDFLDITQDKSFDCFDILNECFGHFVRENFRNNKEDAQYMTPLEIARPYSEIIYKEMEADGYFEAIASLNFKVMDPTCGVGTLLLEAAKCYLKILAKLSDGHQDKLRSSFLNNGIIGQDKVDRMVRLSKINAALYGANPSKFSCGNSIIGTSQIDSYAGSIDLIFTNPPFGAEFQLQSLPNKMQRQIAEDGLTGNRFSSEVLMLYKCLDLLKDGGYLAIVLPDSVISSKGNNERIRKALLKRYDIKSVIELPTVAFAQAGTRTKTSLLLLRKKPSAGGYIIMGSCDSVGFNVKMRAGVPVKVKTETNDMIGISQNYVPSRQIEKSGIVCKRPSITAITHGDLKSYALTPSFYSCECMSLQERLQHCKDINFKYVSLKHVAEFVTKNRSKKSTANGVHHISVLHVRSDSTIDIDEVRTFEPISDGRVCITDDVLMSKLNPSIPRIAVVPSLDFEAVCSLEFEIMRPAIQTVGPCTLSALLRSDSVQKQIRNLTSGTSSSHNRIKTEQLQDVLVPVPATEDGALLYSKLEVQIRNAILAKYRSDCELRAALEKLQSIS